LALHYPLCLTVVLLYYLSWLVLALWWVVKFIPKRQFP